MDLTSNYDMLREFLIEFAPYKVSLPDLEDAWLLHCIVVFYSDLGLSPIWHSLLWDFFSAGLTKNIYIYMYIYIFS